MSARPGPDAAPGGATRLPPARWAALLAGVAALALWAALGLARTTRPPGYFTKYTEAAMQPASALGVRALDLSPLYLAFVRAALPWGGETAVLGAQAALHAGTAILVAATVTVAAGAGWGLVAGAVAALYRPFLVYAGVLEPECLLLFVIAAALLLAQAARGAVDGRAGRALAFAAGMAVGCAGLARPQWLLLAPLLALAVARGECRRRVWATATVVGGAALVVAVFLSQRMAALGEPVVMNPGPVLYEGNHPGALGAVGNAPELVKLAEATVAGEADFAHVVYRQVAAAAMGTTPAAGAANRYWSALAWEHARAHPVEAARTLARKVALALGPYELHDLPEAEEADRRLRRMLPWGFGALLALVPLALAAMRRGAVAVPLAVTAIALLTQVAFYASARQRLPLALALLVAAPVAAATARRVAALLTGGAVLAVAIAWATAPVATLREGEMSLGLGAPKGGAGETIAAWLDGRAWALAERDAVARTLLAPEQWSRGERAAVRSRVLPVASGALDASPWLVARAAAWAARAALAAGDEAEARRWAAAAVAAWPGSLEAQALAETLGRPAADAGGCGGWRPAGVDPLSACFALGREVALRAGPAAGAGVAGPALAAFPALEGRLVR